MKKMITLITVLLLIFGISISSATAQEQVQAGENVQSTIIIEKEAYDPLTPQMFVFDKDNNLFVSLNSVDNTVDLIQYDGEELRRFSVILVDEYVGRHNVQHIYRPKGVAIYQNYVVFLASHRDSCYLGVLDFKGNIISKQFFAGSANAFSYSNEAKELYIAGAMDDGYDMIVLDASNGINNINLDNAVALQYRKPKMSEEIADKDSTGIGMTVIAMSVVFLSLLMLYLVFKGLGKVFLSRYLKREKAYIKVAVSDRKTAAIPADSEMTGEIYAAVATAIHLYNEELHDMENTVLTINKVSRTYSPWSSKIHGLNTYFFNNRGYKK
ncbi:MAG: OadG family protein [Bacteroidales bacterium]|jgi:Na+-transporting methylmalonyl-CoA/oxaloacetate decarboxylase gamma subunit|nr:OadG family protein [Bacteroidales bacterium]